MLTEGKNSAKQLGCTICSWRKVEAVGSLSVWYLSKGRLDKMFIQSGQAFMSKYRPRKEVINSESLAKSKIRTKSSIITRRDSFMADTLDTSKFKTPLKKTNSTIKTILLKALDSVAIFSRLSVEQKEKIAELMEGH
eukprot:TRINITY_DN5560_c0_g1_i1.p1 TRINITY_DN5560_c0_g1~~TRINITY_DN5560_c0_g1_i1.p1  ORF type:complete len:137 (+),score=7.15 TRINITY_DN5560_c0_g1_i1:104-514(+)